MVQHNSCRGVMFNSYLWLKLRAPSERGSVEKALKLVKVEVKLRFSAPIVGIAEIEQDIIESATPCHDAQVIKSYRESNQLCLTVPAAKSKNYTTAPQSIQLRRSKH